MDLWNELTERMQKMEKNNICGKCIHFIKDDFKNMKGHCPLHRNVEFPEHESCGDFTDIANKGIIGYNFQQEDGSDG